MFVIKIWQISGKYFITFGKHIAKICQLFYPNGLQIFRENICQIFVKMISFGIHMFGKYLE